ncbi:DUF6968 family protein [Sorangium sp. So ce367]|uniref:DUF6968 family protein n=1 Tax=Sorangium sp. So ce367 TaxID=3133305 RepID=UPI003F630341
MTNGDVAGRIASTGPSSGSTGASTNFSYPARVPRQKYKIIAVRRYSVEGEPGREIVLKIGEPIQPTSPSGSWTCPVLLDGLEPDIQYVEGLDAVQAIQCAMRYARHALEKCGLPITWLGQEPGDIGLPLPIDGPFGLWFQRRLEKLVDDETERVGEIVAAALKERARRKRGP